MLRFQPAKVYDHAQTPQYEEVNNGINKSKNLAIPII